MFSNYEKCTSETLKVLQLNESVINVDNFILPTTNFVLDNEILVIKNR